MKNIKLWNVYSFVHCPKLSTKYQAQNCSVKHVIDLWRHIWQLPLPAVFSFLKRAQMETEQATYRAQRFSEILSPQIPVSFWQMIPWSDYCSIKMFEFFNASNQLYKLLTFIGWTLIRSVFHNEFSTELIICMLTDASFSMCSYGQASYRIYQNLTECMTNTGSIKCKMKIIQITRMEFPLLKP